MFKVGDVVMLKPNVPLNTNYEQKMFGDSLLVVVALEKDDKYNYVKLTESNLWWVEDRFELAKSAIINQILSEI